MKFALDFKKKLSRMEMAILVVSSCTLAVLFWYLATHVRFAHEEGAFENRTKIMDVFRDKDGNAVSTPNPDRIEPWMNFRYVNVVFKLPEGYLAESLGIDDPKYPNVPIGKYAKKRGLDREKFLEELRRLVSESQNATGK